MKAWYVGSCYKLIGEIMHSPDMNQLAIIDVIKIWYNITNGGLKDLIKKNWSWETTKYRTFFPGVNSKIVTALSYSPIMHGHKKTNLEMNDRATQSIQGNSAA
jgi:hypothetical protein